MSLAWFICGYDISANEKNGLLSVRTCAMNRFTTQIRADSGAWSETEVLGSYAIVKVRAASATLTTIGATTGFYRITNHFVLTDSLSDLTNTQRNAITTRILAMGYTQAEIDATMGNTLALWRGKTFVTLLNFIAQKRLLPYWDAINNQIAFGGGYVGCKPPSLVNTEVTA